MHSLSPAKGDWKNISSYWKVDIRQAFYAHVSLHLLGKHFIVTVPYLSSTVNTEINL